MGLKVQSSMFKVQGGASWELGFPADFADGRR